MSRETVAWVTLQPAPSSASRSSCCVPSRLRSTRLAIRRCRSAFDICNSSCIQPASCMQDCMTTFRRFPAWQSDHHASESNVAGPPCRPRGRFGARHPSARLEDLARGDGRGAAGQEMTKGDAAVEAAADKLEAFVRSARTSGGVKGKVGEALAADPDFLRKLKPSLIKARAKGEAPMNGASGGTPQAPSGPQLTRPKPPKSGSGGPSPWLVIGAALAGGYVLAKLIDWRGHAHPRN